VVGRTPEYLGKKIESFDMKLAMLAVLALAANLLLFTAAPSVADWSTSLGVRLAADVDAHVVAEREADKH
jgi:K+-transporting ATPase A subunit